MTIASIGVVDTVVIVIVVVVAVAVFVVGSSLS